MPAGLQAWAPTFTPARLAHHLGYSLDAPLPPYNIKHFR